MTSRRVILWLCALAVLLNGVWLASITVLRWNGDPGFATVDSAPFYERVVMVRGPALAAGLRVGDTIDVRRDNFTYQLPIPGQPIHFTALRGNVAVPITIVPVPAAVTWDAIVRLLAGFWLVAFALVILVRGVDTRASTLLALVLVAYAIESPLTRIAYPTWLLSTIGGVAFAPIAQSAFVLLAVFAAMFGRPLSQSRRVLTWTTLACALVAAIIEAAYNLGSATAWFYVNYDAFAVAEVLPSLPCVLCGVLAFNAASGGERQRIAWVFVPFAIFWAALYSFFVFQYSTAYALVNAALLAVPVALSYAAVSRRLFDIGFVINRAAVFTGVSFIVVGSFVLLEWALGKWFEDASHVTSVVLNAALALAFGLSLRFVHARVDRFVDRVFFKKRHDDETALRRFAREAAYITDCETLLQRTRAEVLDHTEAASASILLLDGERSVPADASTDPATGIDINDPAIVAMRTWRDALDLHGYATAIAGEYAFPMLAHGALIGVIVCGAKKNGESFAPDEIDALKTLAHGVGIALESLHKGPPESIESLKETLLQAIGALADKVSKALPETKRNEIQP